MPGPSWVCRSVAPATMSGTRTAPSRSNVDNRDGADLTTSYTYVKALKGARSVSAPVDVRAEDAIGDEVAHHLERAAADGEHARVAHHPLERQRAAVAGGAVDLQRLARDPLCRLGRERLGLRRLERLRK